MAQVSEYIQEIKYSNTQIGHYFNRACQERCDLHFSSNKRKIQTLYKLHEYMFITQLADTAPS